MNQLIITGIRGVPAAHGGFETFAENLAIYLVGRGWLVTVYCQESNAERRDIHESDWHGVRRVHIPVSGEGAKATVLFDFLSVKHAIAQLGLVLTLGYNTALFNVLFRLNGKRNLINMDGLEWRRDKWRWYEKAWLYLNERMGCLIGNHLIADHPEIQSHLTSRVNADKITMIPYGARAVINADVNLLKRFDLESRTYAIVIARGEPENSILQIVKAFSAKKRGMKLVVLGTYEQSNPYHQQVILAATDEVYFVGAVYDHAELDALRFYALLYVHGHTVGGTNPSLIEALGAGQPILAQANKYNRWAAGKGAVYFHSQHECEAALDDLLADNVKLYDMSLGSRAQFAQHFLWQDVLQQYEALLLRWSR